MELEKEIELLKYQISLLTHIVGSMPNAEEFSFFTMLLDYGISEHPTKTLLKLCSVLNFRRNGVYTSDAFPTAEENKSWLHQYGIRVEDVYQHTPPTYEEFARYAQLIIGDIKPRYVLQAIKKQHIQAELCEYLLADMKSPKESAGKKVRLIEAEQLWTTKRTRGSKSRQGFYRLLVSI